MAEPSKKNAEAAEKAKEDKAAEAAKHAAEIKNREKEQAEKGTDKHVVKTEEITVAIGGGRKKDILKKTFRDGTVKGRTLRVYDKTGRVVSGTAKPSAKK